MPDEGNWMQVPAPRPGPRQADIDGLSGQCLGLSLSLKTGGEPGELCFYLGAQLVDLAPEFRPFARRKSSDSLLLGGQHSRFSSQVPVPQRAEVVGVSNSGRLAEEPVPDFHQPRNHMTRCAYDNTELLGHL